MVLLPRLARAFNSPVISIILALVLIAVGIFGLASGDIRQRYAIIIVVVGGINLIRAIPHRQAS
jgi:hypothetical protein